MPLTEPHVQTQAELEEAMLHLATEAKAAFDKGNLLRWARRHEQINDLMDEWVWVTFVG